MNYITIRKKYGLSKFSLVSLKHSLRLAYYTGAEQEFYVTPHIKGKIMSSPRPSKPSSDGLVISMLTIQIPPLVDRQQSPNNSPVALTEASFEAGDLPSQEEAKKLFSDSQPVSSVAVSRFSAIGRQGPSGKSKTPPLPAAPESLTPRTRSAGR